MFPRNLGVIHMKSQQYGCLYMAWSRTTPINMLMMKRESSLETSTLEKELGQLGNFIGKVISTGYSIPTDQHWKHMLTRNIIQIEHYAHAWTKVKNKGMILKDRKVDRYMLRFRGNKEKGNIYLHVISKKIRTIF